jgi:hypothetical protein
MRFSLRDVATYYSGQLHQKEALDMIQMYIPESIEERFAEMWRSGPKNEIPTHVSWHEKLKLLLEAEANLPERMDVETVYLLFAELLIQQSSSADPEYASKLLDLIALKRAKKE